MVQQRLKDYKPFKCSKIFHTHLKSQTSKKKGGGGVVSTITESMRRHRTRGASRVNLCSLCRDAADCFSVYYAQVWLLSETHGGQRGAGAARCSKPQPNGSCEAVYRIWAASHCCGVKGEIRQWLPLQRRLKNKHPSNTTTENEQKIKQKQSKMLVARLGIFLNPVRI